MCIRDRPVTADAAIDEAAESNASSFGCAVYRLHRLFEDLFAINPNHDALFVDAGEEVVPLAVADIHLRIKVAAASGHEERQRAAFRMGVELPMRGG